jgi:NhaA family Na+:H+ antiporter
MKSSDIKNSAQSNISKAPIDFLMDPLQRFLHVESASGIVLLLATITALLLANSPWSEEFLAFWKTKIGFTVGFLEMNYSLQHWINDLLMAVFFFVIGLEVKREMVSGELRSLKRAALPICAALGGMIVPAMIYLLLQAGSPAERGWGIPMATDIAFVVGSLAILGSRIPSSLRILLLSLAIADDIGAILVIAIGYTENLQLNFLLLSLGGLIGFIGFYKIGVRNIPIYILLAAVVWFGFHESGVHATMAGVIIGLLTPTKGWIPESRLQTKVQDILHFLQGENWPGSKERYQMLREMERTTRKTVSPLERFENDLHPWVGFIIIPVFALANAGVAINSKVIFNPVAIAVVLGLFIGKPIGIALFSWLAVKMGLGSLPSDLNWPTILGGGCLAGIGFTMALFIASLALQGTLLDAAKAGILIGSLFSAIIGSLLLLIFLKKPQKK